MDSSIFFVQISFISCMHNLVRKPNGDDNETLGIASQAIHNKFMVSLVAVSTVIITQAN